MNGKEEMFKKEEKRRGNLLLNKYQGISYSITIKEGRILAGQEGPMKRGRTAYSFVQKKRVPLSLFEKEKKG